MFAHEPTRVIRFRPSAARVRFARRNVETLVASAQVALGEVEAGDLVKIHGAMLDLLQAVRLVVDHGLDVEREVAV